MEGSSQKLPAQTPNNPKRTKKFWAVSIVSGVAGAILCVFLVALAWYSISLQPVDAQNKTIVRFEVQEGEGSRQIADKLEAAKLIKSSTAMVLYVKLRSTPTTLQAGTYAISPSQSVKEIVTHLEKGKTDVITVTVLPGKTLQEIQSRLVKKYGYTVSEVSAAMKKSYDHPLLADKPATADLEGYIFPETIEVTTGDDVSKLFTRSFDILYDKIKEDKLQDEFSKRGLTLYQAMTLASIVQMEASDPQDQKQISQVLQKRLAMGMKLESDPTFVYAAKKLGVEPRVFVDSPYNTRKYGGLPPGPISNMNYSALQAVAFPAQGEYVYFVAGDDGKTYFSMTLEEHEQNVEKHCKKLCQMF